MHHIKMIDCNDVSRERPNNVCQAKEMRHDERERDVLFLLCLSWQFELSLDNNATLFL